MSVRDILEGTMRTLISALVACIWASVMLRGSLALENTRRVIAESDGRDRSYRCHFDRWLDKVMGIKGIPTPYGAPNASAHIERFIRTLREEALDHFIFLGTRHIRRVLVEYIPY